MDETITRAGLGRAARLRVALLGALVVTSLSAMAGEAGATVRFEHFTDPAGDPTAFTYTLLRQDGTTFASTQLSGDGDYHGFGPPPAVYVMQASPPAGWRVASIQCTDQAGSTAGFQVDLANARVTVDHSTADVNTHHVCAFTNRRIGASGAASSGNTGLAATPLVTGQAAPPRPTRAALVRVTGGRLFATATVRLRRRSVVRAQLLRGRRVVATRRAVLNSGDRRVRVNIRRAQARRLRAQGRRRVTLRLRVVVAERRGTTRVFSLGVRVRL